MSTKATIRAAISGVHGYVPDYVLTNAELESMVDTSDEWIRTRTGIRERRLLKEPNKGSASLGIEAVQGLLKKTDTDPKEVDLIICATMTPDRICPANGQIISHAVGAVNAWSYDLQATCSGFLYALVTATQFIETGKYQTIVVVGADKMSSIVDYQDRSTCILFGDGAGAVLLTPTKEPWGLIDSVLGSDGSGEQYLYQKAGGSRRPASHETVAAREHYIHQEGNVVFKLAVNKMAEVTRKVMERNQLSTEDVAFLVPHQANQRILRAVAQQLQMDEKNVMLTIDRFGNTTAATIPICLWQYEDQLQRGDKLLLTSFGGGFTWGAAYVIWTYSTT